MSDPVNDTPARLVQKTLTLAPPNPMVEIWELAPNIEERAKVLIERHSMEAKHFRIAYFWRSRGGKTKGRNQMGKVIPISKPNRVLSGFDAILWIAADHFENQPEKLIEAEIFDQLCHIGSHEDTGELVLMAPDFSGFLASIDTYGTYTLPLTQAKAHFEQAKIAEFTVG